jgi:hypothetical protein
VVSGVIEAPVDEVWGALVDETECLSANEKRALKQTGPAQPLRKKVADGLADMEVDATRRSISSQGHWWYRAVTSVEAHPRGSLITYSVYNIAPGAGWWIAQLFQGPQHARKMHLSHAQTIEALGRTLHCAARISVTTPNR